MSSSDDVILVQDRYYILATSSITDQGRLVAKHDDTFAVFDRTGDLGAVTGAQQGLFRRDTRFLCKLELRLGNSRLLLLSSTVTHDNAQITVDLANADVIDQGELVIPRDTIHVFRGAFVWDDTCYLTMRARSYTDQTIAVPLRLRFDADFADIFEVRGARRDRRGDLLEPRVAAASVRLSCDGLDRRRRATTLSFDPPPDELTATSATWQLQLGPGEEVTVRATVHCDDGDHGNGRDRDGAPARVEVARRAMSGAVERARARWCQLETSHDQLDEWLRRSRVDLRMLTTETPSGPYPYAGVPWYSTVFGRDGLITALQTLWVNPELSAGVLRFLAATQATAVEPAHDAEPGKIVHELRAGEMAALGEVPFGRYYGSADATPLFVMLAGAYHRHTADDALIEALWPSLERALRWIGDRCDRDGFVTYARLDERGLANQGWKDSVDAVFHADGALATDPIALCEVQGYAHAALLAGAALAASRGRDRHAAELGHRAEELRGRVERAFWCTELDTYALALDGDRRPCRVRTSNPGHLLFTGTVDPERAAAVARTLLADPSFSGWGVRTVAASERRYNPMSYHNGSVWPHDNAIIAAGLARYGNKHDAERIFSGMFDAAVSVPMHRLPELFCGLPRRPDEGPTLYPVACAPQAWAAGAVFLMLQACLGLSVDGRQGRVILHRPSLPRWLRWIRMRDLRVGAGRIDLELRRHRDHVAVRVLRRDRDVELLTVG